VLEAFFDRLLTPGEVFFEFFSAFAFEFFGEVEEAFGGSVVFVEEDVFDCFEEVEEGGVHGFADGVVTAEGEGDVGDAAGDFGEGEVFFDPAGGVDEVEGVVVMLFDSGGDGEDVGVEDDVFGREADFVDEDVVGAFADAAFVIVGGGLALFIEGHDDGGGPVIKDVAGVFFKGFFAFFEGDGVDDAFALRSRNLAIMTLPSMRPSSKQMSMTLAPLTTCWRATSRASSSLSS